MLDSHAHLLSRDIVLFPPANPTPEKLAYLQEHGFDATDLRSAMDRTGVAQALIVQRGQFYGADNSYVCAAASESGGRLRAICGIDSRQPDCGQQAAKWLNQGAAGFRIMGRPTEQTLGWLADESAQILWRFCADLGAVLSTHLFPAARHEGLGLIEQMLDRFPMRWLVIDHLSNPPIDNAANIDEAIRRLADRPNVALKFTTIPLGALTEQGMDAGAFLEPYISLFGAERLMWGSDITQSPGTYPEMVSLARYATANLSAQIKNELLGDAARRIYGWEINQAN